MKMEEETEKETKVTKRNNLRFIFGSGAFGKKRADVDVHF